MKSRKARAMLDRATSEHISLYGWVTYDEAVASVELAEQEAEKRMREKAIYAFRSSCKYQDGCHVANRKCDPRQCEDLESFIQKLNE